MSSDGLCRFFVDDVGTGDYSSTPVCFERFLGIPPNCTPIPAGVQEKCPAGSVDRGNGCFTFTNEGRFEPVCYRGETGIPPDCVGIAYDECLEGFTGIPPNCTRLGNTTTIPASPSPSPSTSPYPTSTHRPQGLS